MGGRREGGTEEGREGRREGGKERGREGGRQREVEERKRTMTCFATNGSQYAQHS